MTFLKWFAIPLDFISVFCKKFEDTSVSHKYKNIYQSSHKENKNSCQNPAIAGAVSIHATKQRFVLPFDRYVLQREINAAVLSSELDQLKNNGRLRAAAYNSSIPVVYTDIISPTKHF